jgi:hypothetical protein
MIDEQLYASWRDLWLRLAERPGVQLYWAEEQAVFSEGFRDEINKLLAAQQGPD